MFMNEVEIEMLASRPYACPNVCAGVRLLRTLMRSVNAQSDGWAHWPSPSRSCTKLQNLLKKAGTHGTVTDVQLRQAVAPIRAMVMRESKRQKKFGNTFEFDVDAALGELAPISLPAARPTAVMTVDVLIRQLSQMPPKAVAVLSSDPEGNAFRPVHMLDGPGPLEGYEHLGDNVVILWPRDNY